ncbi:4-(cytidine 5'-diphospho)-2-C-methyl-D-erythritol kinase [Hyphococcus flavus]|uniref:4-diphosphocytidyl-2-C-methyl-D-erythritol kinase n=1 Tax=Hyphococcus flavus TaxID=1866326 RepID=A0AAE9ZLY4_9PROT|nr:4-(cytidine 5'-diphospho)-2-C-methyl-D-erythritol kinase [Hyphococcus flavus]WDI33210.1 4-(cytidine 5'-diphospho)-2-C-methyl-D-erythritol kinase [Hyphococcus flavus]
MIVETAPAKINLYLHVGPLRSDGFHELASLFVFASKGDIVQVEASNNITLEITGPYAEELAGAPVKENLVWRAAEALRSATQTNHGAAITLNKQLPVAAGVGGGSADAAAALRALGRLWKVDISTDALERLAFRLGADVPACLYRSPVSVTGAGERVEAGPALPPLWCCLVNPGVPMPTGPIFRAFDTAYKNPKLPETVVMGRVDYTTLSFALQQTSNDLEPFACERAPVILSVLEQMRSAPGAMLARMSGSGATCFGLFSSGAAAERAAQKARGHGWWALASALHVR